MYNFDFLCFDKLKMSTLYLHREQVNVQRATVAQKGQKLQRAPST